MLEMGTDLDAGVDAAGAGGAHATHRALVSASIVNGSGRIAR
jgi:hypothetical protein